MLSWLGSRCPSGTSVLSWLQGWGAGVQMVQVCCHGYRVGEQVSKGTSVLSWLQGWGAGVQRYKCVVMVT